MVFVARLRSNVVTCPVDMGGWIICVCSIDSDISTRSKSRDVISWDIRLGVPGCDPKNHTLLGNLSQDCLDDRGDRTGHSCCPNLRRYHCGETIIKDQGCQNELCEPRTITEGANFVHIQPDPRKLNTGGEPIGEQFGPPTLRLWGKPIRENLTKTFCMK